MIVDLIKKLGILDAPVREVYPYNIDINFFIQRFCRENNIKAIDFLSESRKGNLVNARKRLAKTLVEGGYTREQIGQAFNRDQSTITHYIKPKNE